MVKQYLRRARDLFTKALLQVVRADVERSRLQLADVTQRTLLLQGAVAAMASAERERLPSRLPEVRQSFIEFGVTSYVEANTRFLLQHRNWRGLIAEAEASAVAVIRDDPLRWQYDLSVAEAFITRENINGLFASHGFIGRIGLLSVDIDGNDYWIWRAVDSEDPDIVICEYNAVFGDLHPITIPYNPSFTRTAAHHSNLYWGTSIGALQQLASEKGYTLVGTNREGCNAFFVRSDLASRLMPLIDDARPRPSLYRESRDRSGTMTYLSGKARASAITAMPVVNVRTGETVEIRTLGELSSDHWSELMGS